MADKGFARREFGAFLYRSAPCTLGKITRGRQWAEAVIDTLNGRFSIEQHGARPWPESLPALVNALLALAAAMWRNWTTGAPDKRSLIA
ncbi:hypothetical protein P3G67_30835 [Streptomyces sp. RB6PN23]|uniref:Transposase DDE domain-containing protein n=1 Tax=Streptomyces silvisoli TaxID=3034235 RepID=A0ABT5ZUN1_9ACTN|nr:hypothetical protein [Streptomyces silvisoli]MDF3293534.1 hypothetical protein [Streptomyces silvisoli]